MNVYKTFCFIILISFLNCNQKPSVLSNTDKEIIVVEIRKMFDNYHNDIKKDGLEAEFKYLDNSSDFFWVPPDYDVALSYDSVKAILISNSKFINTIQFSWDKLQVFPLSNTIANYSGIVTGKMTDTTHMASTFKIIESGTLIKHRDGWKLLNGQSRNLPATNN